MKHELLMIQLLTTMISQNNSIISLLLCNPHVDDEIRKNVNDGVASAIETIHSMNNFFEREIVKKVTI